MWKEDSFIGPYKTIYILRIYTEDYGPKIDVYNLFIKHYKIVLTTLTSFLYNEIGFKGYKKYRGAMYW
jgi:hypothetical protein